MVKPTRGRLEFQIWVARTAVLFASPCMVSSTTSERRGRMNVKADRLNLTAAMSLLTSHEDAMRSYIDALSVLAG